MEPSQIALVLKPLAFFILAALVLYPIRRAVIKWWPDGKLKRLLLRRIN
jgi:hypothetical protein